MYFLGTITVGAATFKDNTTTAVPFTIPKGTRKIGLQADVINALFACSLTAGFGPASAAVARKMATADEFFILDFSDQGGTPQGLVVGVFNPSGTVNVRVFRML